MPDSPIVDLPVTPRSIVETYREIESALTAPGAPYEMHEVPAASGAGTVRGYLQATASLYDIVAAYGEQFPDNTLVVGDGDDRTYAEVFARARGLATALHDEFGIRAGDRVGIMMANRAAYLISLFAITRLGAVAVLFNSRASATEARAATDDVECGVIVADPRSAQLLAGIDAAATLILTEASPEVPAAPLVDDIIAAAGEDVAAAEVSPEDPSLILFTSGTSGRAKGVALTQRNVATVVVNMRFVADTNLEFASRTYGMSVADLRAFLPTISALLIFPLFHVSGIAALMVTMSSGGTVATMRKWDASAAMGLIEKHRLTLMAGPPMTVNDLLSLPDPGGALGSLVNVVPGGQATPPNITTRIADELPNARRSAGWGMTEVGGSVCTAGGDILGAFPLTSGPMSPTMDVRVTDGEVELSPGEVGELELRGGQVMAGYVGRPEDTADAFHDGWLRTGDVGYVDEFGLVYIVDRKKDLVISSGENISCVEVESALAVSDRFVEVAAFGVPDDRLGERLIVAVTLRDDRPPLDPEAIRDIARATLPPYKVPTAVVLDMGPLPRSATGKILKREIRRMYLERPNT